MGEALPLKADQGGIEGGNININIKINMINDGDYCQTPG